MLRIVMILLSVVMAGLPAEAAAQGRYKPTGAIGEGYRDREVRPGFWKVSASYSAASGGRGTAIAAANYRAAALLKRRGFRYMRVVKVGGFDLGLSVGDSWSVGGGPGYAWLIVRGASGAQDVQGCEMRDAGQCRTLAVDDVMAEWRGALRLDR